MKETCLRIVDNHIAAVGLDVLNMLKIDLLADLRRGERLLIRRAEDFHRFELRDSVRCLEPEIPRPEHHHGVDTEQPPVDEHLVSSAQRINIHSEREPLRWGERRFKRVRCMEFPCSVEISGENALVIEPNHVREGLRGGVIEVEIDSRACAAHRHLERVRGGPQSIELR